MFGSTIPIVMAVVADPVGSGRLANLAHPAQVSWRFDYDRHFR
jgi:ABC-type uncharacterized transport system substrate-binding protein